MRKNTFFCVYCGKETALDLKEKYKGTCGQDLCLTRQEYFEMVQQHEENRKKKKSALYRMVNANYQLLMAIIPISFMLIIFSTVAGFVSGVCSTVFMYFFNIFG